jgi:hypothetical protein
LLVAVLVVLQVQETLVAVVEQVVIAVQLR